VIERLETLAHGTPEEIVLQALEGQQPCEARELVKRLALSTEDTQRALNAMLADDRVLLIDDLDGTTVTLPRPETSARFLISGFGWRELKERMRAALSAYHRTHPLRKGMPREELRSRLQERTPGLSGRLFNQVIARTVYEGIISENEASIWSSDHAVQFTPEQQQRIDDLMARFRRTPYITPSFTECVSQLGEELLGALIESGTLIRLSAEVVYMAETVAEMRVRVIDQIRQHGSVTIAQVRDLLDISRKYALALMEYLDEQRVTKRIDDVRVLR
jgi:selenocysteine-specific elongation factor